MSASSANGSWQFRLSYQGVALRFAFAPIAAALSMGTLPLAAPTPRLARAVFLPDDVSQVTGNVTFVETEHGVLVHLVLSAAPQGVRGVHIHELGDCSDLDAESMGPHFAPATTPHGLPSSPEHHMGDLGNVQIDGQGFAELILTVEGANLEPGHQRSLLGRSIDLHQGVDRGVGATGEAGRAIACSEIRAGLLCNEPSCTLGR